MVRKDLLSSLFFIFLSIFICWQSLDLGFGRLSKPGPGFFSFLSSLGLGFLAIIIFFKSRLAKVLREEISGERIPWKPLVITFGSLVGFTFFINTLGFNLSTFLLMGIILWAVGKRSWALSVMVSLSITFGSYILFGLFLQSQLPEGPFGVFGF